MTKYSSSFQRKVLRITLRALICFTILKPCRPRNSFYDLDLSAQTLNPGVTGFMMTGNAVNDYFGISVNTAGDIDNDGYDDIIVGAYGKNSFQGAVYVIYGGEESSFLDIDLNTKILDPLTTGFMITGIATNDYFGISVSPAGDIDNDGYDDIIVGGSHLTNGGQGAAYVVYGGARSTRSNIVLSSTTLNPLTTGFMITENAINVQFGNSVSTAGDINNDGYGDIIVGAHLTSNSQGAVYVIYGGAKSTMSNIVLSSTTLNPLTTGFMITGNAASNSLGYSVSTAGDINGDGYDDIIVGAHETNNNQGAAYVIYGGAKSTMSNIALSSTILYPTSTGFTITGNAVGDYFGLSVSKAGDINNDGYDDIIIGAPDKNSKQGVAYVIYGGAKSSMSNIVLSSMTLNPLTTGFMITGNAADDFLGVSVSTAGDINNDGYDDIIVGANRKSSNQGAAYLIYASCSKNCKQCSSESVCTECKSPYLLYQSECLESCPLATFSSTDICKNCPSYCSSCTSQDTCQVCFQGFTLSNSLCVLPSPSDSSSQEAQEKASQVIASATQGIGSVVSVGSSIFPFSALVSKIVQNTRYLNLSVTSELAEVYQSWQTDLISWDVPNLMSDLDHFETSHALFAQYDLGSPFLVNFWPTLINVGIGFGTFIACILLQKVFEHEKYEGWAYSLVRKLVAGSFNFALIQAYACLDDILFYLILDAKTNPFNSFFSWTSMICAVLFLALGCLQVFFNFWTVYKYQSIKIQEVNNLEAFNERNKYWELFYSDFNDDDIWSQSFFAIAIIRSTLSSFIITVFYEYPLIQTSYLVVMDGAIISFLYFKTPFNTLRGKLAQYYYEIITLLVHLCAFILALQDSFDHSSDTVRLIMSTGILYLNTALISGAIGFMFIEIYKTISEKTRAARLKKRHGTPEDNQETQNLTRREPSGSVTRKGQDWEQTASIENFHLEPENNQNRNFVTSDLNMESNFHNENSMLSDMNQRHRINQQRNQSPVPIMIRHRPQAMNQRRQRNNPRNPNYIVNY